MNRDAPLLLLPAGARSITVNVLKLLFVPDVARIASEKF